MLTRRKPMPRGKGFSTVDPQRARERVAQRKRNLQVLARTVGRAATMGGSTRGAPIAKENASQSGAYQAAVRSLGYCMRCGCSLRPGERQFCHADQGKGAGLKTDVRRGWLGCAGCHYHVGTSGRLAKALRRALELFLAWKTRTTLRRRGLWPNSLPDTWAEQDVLNAPPNPEAPST